jgi:hypothetical protein
MSIADYAHLNEDAKMVWWLEEGQHPYEPPYDCANPDDDPDAGWEDEDEDEGEVDSGYAGLEDLGWDGGLED